MRIRSLPAIVDSWYNLIACYAGTNTTIAKQVFEVLSNYVGKL
jgi:hypothetical protein